MHRRSNAAGVLSTGCQRSETTELPEDSDVADEDRLLDPGDLLDGLGVRFFGRGWLSKPRSRDDIGFPQFGAVSPAILIHWNQMSANGKNGRSCSP